LKGWAIVKEYAAPPGLGSSPTRCDGATARRVGWERMPKAGEGFSFFGFGSTNMPRRRRWGRTPCQNHFALDVWGERARLACGLPSQVPAQISALI